MMIDLLKHPDVQLLKQVRIIYYFVFFNRVLFSIGRPRRPSQPRQAGSQRCSFANISHGRIRAPAPCVVREQLRFLVFFNICWNPRIQKVFSFSYTRNARFQLYRSVSGRSTALESRPAVFGIIPTTGTGTVTVTVQFLRMERRKLLNLTVIFRFRSRLTSILILILGL